MAKRYIVIIRHDDKMNNDKMTKWHNGKKGDLKRRFKKEI